MAHGSVAAATPPPLEEWCRSARGPHCRSGGGSARRGMRRHAGTTPRTRRRDRTPEPKRCRHCDESRSPCGGGGGTSGSSGRASWRVTLDHDLVETLSAIYPEWFKPQHRRPAAPASPPSPHTPPSDDTFSSGAEEMAGRQAGSSGASEPSSSPRVSPPKVIVDDSPLQPAMGKHKESLKVKLMMRRPINQLVAQGIMPPSKTPPAYFEQCKQLERAKTGDLLKAKIQRRPDRQELERRHILEQESHVDPSLAEKQRMLKKARLADQLNDQLSHRPGPLELIKKNILHTEETIETAVKSGSLAFKATSEGASARPPHPSSYCGPPEDVSPSPSPPSTLSPASVHSPPQHPAPGKDKPRKKNCKKQQTPKARFKFHEYKGPPNARAAAVPAGSVETPYELLLQQQQLLLQLMLPASPAPSAASDSSDAYCAPPPPPPPPAPAPPAARFEDMKVSDLRAECKRRNLRVSGPKPQLIDRLRQEERPKSPASVASVGSPEAPQDQSEDIVRSQQRQIEELERKLEASRQQLEAVRCEAAGASDQSRRLLQAYLCVSQLRAQLDALQAPPPPPRPQYVLAAPAPDAAPDRLVRLFTVASPAPAPDLPADAAPKPAAGTYILNGVKVVPIAILPSPAHFEPERAPPPPPPLPPPMPAARDSSEESQIMDDVLEILVENGELPPSAVERAEGEAQEPFSPADVLGGAPLAEGGPRARDCGDLQRELDDIQNEIMSHADMQAGGRPGPELDPELSMDLLSNGDFHAEFAHDTAAADGDDFFDRFLSAHARDERRSPAPMDVADEPMPPLLEHSRHGFDYIDDLSLPSFQSEDTRHGFEERAEPEAPPDLVGMAVDADGYDLMETDLFPNMFGRGHVPQCDPLLGGVLARPPPRPPPRPALKHYSWDKYEFDAT